MQAAVPSGKEKAGGRQGGYEVDRRPVPGGDGARQGKIRLRSGVECSIAPERLVGLELDLDRAQAEVAQRAMVEVGELAPLARPAAPGAEDLVERRVGAGQRRLGGEMQRDV